MYIRNLNFAMLYYYTLTSLRSSFLGLEVNPSSLQPVLFEEKGYFQLGPITDTNQIFLLSVTIGFASNLAKVGNILLMNHVNCSKTALISVVTIKIQYTTVYTSSYIIYVFIH